MRIHHNGAPTGAPRMYSCASSLYFQTHIWMGALRGFLSDLFDCARACFFGCTVNSDCRRFWGDVAATEELVCGSEIFINFGTMLEYGRAERCAKARFETEAERKRVSERKQRLRQKARIWDALAPSCLRQPTRERV